MSQDDAVRMPPAAAPAAEIDPEIGPASDAASDATSDATSDAAAAPSGAASVPNGPVAHVDLAAIVRNARRLGDAAGDRPVMAAVKADAYGHGAVPVARALERSGVGWFGVATAAEALALREAGIGGRILVFGPLADAPDVVAAALAAGVDLTVTDAAAIDRAASLAAHASERIAVHLKLDTGMGRLGVSADRAVELARRIARAPALAFAAVWTHLAVADAPDRDADTREQLARFDGALAALDAAGLRPPLAHAANTAGITRVPASRYDLVRPGIGLYGYHASPEAAAEAAEAGIHLEPALRLTAPVTFVKRVAAGTPVSYGATWRAPRPTTVATTRIGYADGYLRALSNRARASIGGRPAVVAGRVCMDQTMFALEGDDPAPRLGATAELIGGRGPSAAELAELGGTIPYEILVRLGSRVERVYRGSAS